MPPSVKGEPLRAQGSGPCPLWTCKWGGPFFCLMDSHVWGIRTGLGDGPVGKVCPQGCPRWEAGRRLSGCSSPAQGRVRGPAPRKTLSQKLVLAAKWAPWGSQLHPGVLSLCRGKAACGSGMMAEHRGHSAGRQRVTWGWEQLREFCALDSQRGPVFSGVWWLGEV